jgi:hypothetical protein
VKEIKLSEDTGAADSGSQTITPPTGGIRVGGSADVTFKKADDVRALARDRPVEVMLRDPLGEVARKERRSLLGISAIAILVGRTGLVPAKIDNFGISFAAPERQALLWVFLAVVLYYTVAFIVYAMSDFLMYRYAVHQGREALKKQRAEHSSLDISIISETPSKPPDAPWSLVGYVTWASVGRGIFDFLIPLVVSGVAVWSLVGAVSQVTTKATTAPTAPAVAPSTPHGTAPSLKTAPAPSTR